MITFAVSSKYIYIYIYYICILYIYIFCIYIVVRKRRNKIITCTGDNEYDKMIKLTYLNDEDIPSIINTFTKKDFNMWFIIGQKLHIELSTLAEIFNHHNNNEDRFKEMLKKCVLRDTTIKEFICVIKNQELYNNYQNLLELFSVDDEYIVYKGLTEEHCNERWE